MLTCFWEIILLTSDCQYFACNSYSGSAGKFIFLRKAVVVILPLLAGFMDLKIIVVLAGTPLAPQHLSGSALDH